MLNMTEQQFKEYKESLTNGGEIAVLETLDCGDFDDTLSELENVYNYGCVCGIGGFTYYHETEEFFDSHSSDILESVEKYSNESNSDLYSIEFNKNGLTWFFVNKTVEKMVNKIEG